MKIIRALIKISIFVVTLIIYSFATILIYILSGFNLRLARPYLIRVISITSKIGLKIIGINVVLNSHATFSQENCLIVSNHLSYVDIMVISSIFPSCFITSKEMRKTFFLGQICLLAGCLFVDRKNHKNIHKEILNLTEALKEGLSITIFPEASSTNGSSIIRFRRPLFQAAIDSKINVLPLCLNYKSIDTVSITPENRDVVFWYGDMSFLKHAFYLFSHRKIVVDLNVMPFLNINDYNDKIQLADKCYEQINAHYTNII